MEIPTEAEHQFLLYVDGPDVRLAPQIITFHWLTYVDLCSGATGWSITLRLRKDDRRFTLSNIPLGRILHALEQSKALSYAEDRSTVSFAMPAMGGIPLAERQEQKPLVIQRGELTLQEEVEFPQGLACLKLDAYQNMDRGQQLLIMQLGPQESDCMQLILRVLSGCLITSLCQLGVFTNLSYDKDRCTADVVVRRDGGVQLRMLS